MLWKRKRWKIPQKMNLISKILILPPSKINQNKKKSSTLISNKKLLPINKETPSH